MECQYLSRILWGDHVINKRLILGTLCVAFVIYSARVYTGGTAAGQTDVMSASARHGQQVFQEHNCIACHQFYGLGGYMGPDLTNVIRHRGEAYSRAFITAGTARMPNFNLSVEDTDALIDFLSFVDQTGTYPPEDYQVGWNGLVTQADDPQ